MMTQPTIISNQARHVVQEYLRKTEEEDPSARSALRQGFLQLGFAMVPALEEALSTEDRIARLGITEILLLFEEAFPSNAVSSDLLKRATCVLCDALSSKDIWECLGALYVCIELDAPPKGARKVVESLLDHDETGIRVASAAAMTRYVGMEDEEPNSERVSIQKLVDRLEQGIEQSSAVIMASAARGLSILGRDCEAAASALLECLSGPLETSEAVAVLDALGSLGRHPPSLLPSLADYVGDPGRPVSLRAMAAQVVGKLASTPVELDEFFEAVGENDREVINGAMMGIAEGCVHHDEVLARMVDLLENGDVDERGLAASIFSVAPDSARRAGDALMRRIGVERNLSVVIQLSDAIAHLGNAILDDLIEHIRSGDVVSIALASISLRSMGTDGVRALVNAAKTEQDLNVRGVLLIVLRDTGPSVIPIVSELAECLMDEEEDIVDIVLDTLNAVGFASATALPALVNVMAADNFALSRKAEQTIQNIGAEAVPFLETVMKGDVSAEFSSRIESLIGWLRHHSDPEAALLAQFTDSQLLLFNDMSTMISESSPLSWEKMARQLSKMWNQTVSTRRLRDLVRDLQTTGTEKSILRPTTRGQFLTPQGARLTRKVRIYLLEKGVWPCEGRPRL